MPRSISSPSRNDGVTITCPVCRGRFVPVGRQRVCSPACRQAAYRRRHHAATDALLLVLPHRSRRTETVYECPSCETRYLGTQRCSECGVFCRRVGAGGLCPGCGEPVAVADLLDGTAGRA
jgi:hypothetical protein